MKKMTIQMKKEPQSPVTISLVEWEDYYIIQQSGEMNMWHHPLIKKFAPDGNWKAAFEHFEEEGNTATLVIGDMEAEEEEEE